MNAKQESIAARRRALIGEIARQRESLGQQVESWAAPLALVDQGVTALRYVRRHPVLFAGAVSLLLTLRRGGHGGTWFGRGLIAWRMFNEFSRLRAPTVRHQTEPLLLEGPASRRS